MKFKKIALMTVVTFMFALSSLASASIVDNGDYTTVNGSDWLDMSFTKGLSYNDVLSRLNTGGTLETWSVASFNQVASMYQAFGYVNTPNDTSQNWDSNGTNDVFRLGVLPLLGSTYRVESQMGTQSQRVFEFIVGNVSNADPVTANQQQTVQVGHDNDIPSHTGKSYWQGNTWGYTWDAADEWVGTYLVRSAINAPALSNETVTTTPTGNNETAANVTSPMSVLLFGLGFVGMSAYRRKKIK